MAVLLVLFIVRDLLSEKPNFSFYLSLGQRQAYDNRNLGVKLKLQGNKKGKKQHLIRLVI